MPCGLAARQVHNIIVANRVSLIQNIPRDAKNSISLIFANRLGIRRLRMLLQRDHEESPMANVDSVSAFTFATWRRILPVTQANRRRDQVVAG